MTAANQGCLWQKLEIFLNTANHCLIAITTFYLTWYTLQFDDLFGATQQHAFITTIGYQLLMAEGILTFYSANSLTFVSSRNEKRTLHWLLQVAGSGMALYGIIVEIISIEKRGRTHFGTLHSLYGLVSMIFLCISMVTGLAALFALEARKLIKPVYMKLSHNLLSLTTFVTGMVSTIYAYDLHRWGRTYDPGNMRIMTMWFLGFITFLTAIGALKSLWMQLSGTLKVLGSNDVKDSEKTSDVNRD